MIKEDVNKNKLPQKNTNVLGKNTTPKEIVKPNTLTPTTTPKKVSYEYIGEKPAKQEIKEETIKPKFSTSTKPKTLTSTPEKTNYKYVGKETLGEAIKKAVPEQLIPTERIGAIFGGVFLLVIIIAAFQFPFSSLMAGNIDVVVDIGYPWPFLELELTATDKSPLRPIMLVIDILLYLLIAYLIDIALSLVLKNPLLKSEEELKGRVTTFKDRKVSIAERAAEKVVGKIPKKKEVIPSRFPQKPSQQSSQPPRP